MKSPGRLGDRGFKDGRRGVGGAGNYLPSCLFKSMVALLSVPPHSTAKDRHAPSTARQRDRRRRNARPPSNLLSNLVRSCESASGRKTSPFVIGALEHKENRRASRYILYTWESETQVTRRQSEQRLLAPSPQQASSILWPSKEGISDPLHHWSGPRTIRISGHVLSIQQRWVASITSNYDPRLLSLIA
jgi:hypothetical protein